MRKQLMMLAMICVMSSTAQNPLKQYYTTQITGGDMKALEQTDVNFMLSLDSDRLLYFFRSQAGLSNPSGVTNYGGWENSDLRGHTLGHYLTALSILYAQTGDTNVKSRIDHIVDVLREVQLKQGSGYISAFGESMLDRVESDGSGWAPYYTLHKILQGLVDAYTHTGNDVALLAASDFATYIYGRTTKLTDEAKWIRNLDIQEVGGFAEAVLNVYKYTNDDRHLKAGQFFQQMDKLLPSSEGNDILHDARTENFHHANSTIPQFIASEREYELTGNTTLLLAAKNFWENVTVHRSYCNGSTSYHEHWNNLPDRMSLELDGLAGETCCTNNLIKLSNDLFRFTADAKYAEYVERATLNHIMGSINPDNGNFMYFHTQLPGSYKTFGRNTDVFWCCTGTGMENHVRYGQSVYFSNDDELYVCQFFPSSIDWTETGLKLTQETLFPNEEHTKIRITEGTASATIKIRIPTWCDGFNIKVNGEDVEKADENRFCRITRTWTAGDVIDIDIPMHLRVEPLKDKPRTGALFYGPLVLAGNLGNAGVTYDRVNLTDNYYNGYPSDFKPSTPVPVLTGQMDDLSWIEKTTGKMEFTTTSTGDNSELTFLPLYKAVNIRFADYWNFHGDLDATSLIYPVEKTSAQPVTQLEDGEEYAIINANTSLSSRYLYWQSGDLRTSSSGNLDDVKFLAKKHEVDGETYWSFKVTSSYNRNTYLGRNNHANAQSSSSEALWSAVYKESADLDGNGFELLLKGDAPNGGHEMMMNATGDWVVVWKGDRGSDYTDKTSHWCFYKTSELDQSSMAAYNAANLLLYQYLTEASQMYERGISDVIPSYNNGIKVYTNPYNTVDEINAAIDDIHSAICSSVGSYVEGETATYGIINPSFENLSTQNDVPTSGAVTRPVPFGWTLTKNGSEVTVPDWAWCSINGDGGLYKDGNYIWGVWNGGSYGNIELSQTLHGLQNGSWRLSARLMNNNKENGDNARIFSNNCSMLAGNESDYSSLPSGEDCTFSGEWSTADDDMHQVMAVVTDVTDGTLKFGVRSNGFFKVDDFKLTYLGDLTGIEAVSTDTYGMTDNGIYDISGRRLSTIPEHGLFIQNHKKILR